MIMKKFLILALWFTSLAVQPTANAVANTVVINELKCDGIDAIELYNPTNSRVDLSGWALTDRNPATENPTPKHVYRFTTGKVIEAKGYVVVRQNPVNTGLLFGIDCTRQETIYLGRGSGVLWTEVDRINPPAFEVGNTYGRISDGASTWGHTVPTIGSANENLLPKLVGKTSYTCKAKLKCTIALAATRNGTFSLAAAKTGVAVTSAGSLTISKRKKQTMTVGIKITNGYGYSTTTLQIKFV